MNVSCSKCGQVLSISANLYGRQGRCPTCQTIMTFPKPQQQGVAGASVSVGTAPQAPSGLGETIPLPNQPPTSLNDHRTVPEAGVPGTQSFRHSTTATADVQTCRICSRGNPPFAHYCYFDGSSLSADHQDGPMCAGSMAFSSPFFFSDGSTCANFNELAFACHNNWSEALLHLSEGNWQTFFGNIGRLDLSLVAKEAAKHPDPDQGMSQLLDRFPADAEFLRPAELSVRPTEEDLGDLVPGTNRTFELTIVNQGMLLLQGLLWSDCDWLAFGENLGVSQKVFQTRDFYTLSVRVLGHKLRAGRVPLKGEIIVDTNGGKTTIPVTAKVPIRPFPRPPEVANESLAGATSPRGVAVQAKSKLKEAAVLFEAGDVRRWYESNGWTYPVSGASASGRAAIQQFFEALGLTKPPQLQINKQGLEFRGTMGHRLSASLTVSTDETKPIFAHGWSDQPWVEVGPFLRINHEIRILVEVLVPPRPGEIVHSQIQIRGNGNQVFTVPVTVAVEDEELS